MQQIQVLSEYGIDLTESQILENSKKTVIVGMSGGVDSSVSALLIKMMGHKTIGMFMKNWEEIGDDGVCTATEDFSDVVQVCEKLDIPYYSINFSKEYKEQVFDHFLKEYEKGHTPNPDILCNREIKFKVFYEKIKEFGADYLATGHYCQKEMVDGHLFLKKGHDQNKDQTYFLYAIQENILKDVLFPVGHLPKPKVRELAEKFSLITHNKKDSTGICFIGERNFKQFLGQYIKSQKGHFVQLDTHKDLGEHEGMCFYTIGQRKGLGLGGPGGPWFVADKCPETNTVFVVEGENHPALYADELYADELTWISTDFEFPLRCKAKIRYRQSDQECLITQDESGLKVVFDKPQRAISVEQSIVFYQGNLCLGGAIIKKAGQSYYQQKKILPTF